MRAVAAAFFLMMCWLPVGSTGARAQPAAEKSAANPFDNPEAFKPDPVKQPPAPKRVLEFVRLTDIADDPDKFIGTTLKTTLWISSSFIGIEKIKNRQDGKVVFDGALLSAYDGTRDTRESFGNHLALISDELAIVMRSRPMARFLKDKLTRLDNHKCDVTASVEQMSDETGRPITALVIHSLEVTLTYKEGNTEFIQRRLKISEEEFAGRE